MCRMAEFLTFKNTKTSAITRQEIETALAEPFPTHLGAKSGRELTAEQVATVAVDREKKSARPSNDVT